MHSLLTRLSLLAALYTTAAQAGTISPTVIPPTAPTSAYDTLWNAFSLYKSEHGWLNELRIIGRYQGQYHWADGDSQDSDFWENRRERLGLRLVMLEKRLILNSEWSWNELPAAYPAEFSELWMEYKEVDGQGINWRIGKWMPLFGYDFGVSSREIIVFERPAFVNGMGIFFTPGVRVGGRHGDWSWYLNAHSNTTDQYLGDLSGGHTTLINLGYDAKAALHWDKADFRIDYMNSQIQAEDVRLNVFENSLSLNFSGKKGHWGLNTDIIYATGTPGDAAMGMVMPTYAITPKLELVLRYQVATGSEATTLRPQRRYESFTDTQRGDSYQAGMIGLNYYLYGHKLKLMTALEYSQLSGSSSTGSQENLTLYTGIRIHL